MSEIRIVRLLSGEEIIGLVTDTPTSVTIDKPLLVSVAPSNKPGDINLHLFPYLALAKKNEIEISKQVVVSVYEPVDPLQAKYRQFHSGIIEPNREIIQKIG